MIVFAVWVVFKLMHVDVNGFEAGALAMAGMAELFFDTLVIFSVLDFLNDKRKVM